jgi:hypothetical protein
LNNYIIATEVQEYIRENLNADVHRIAMAKSPFPGITGQELSAQIAARKKSVRKLPAWYATEGIYYPPLLSVEQCSSEITAAYKAGLSLGGTLIDLTGGFGVDSYYFSRVNNLVFHCEINSELSAIAAYNAPLLGQEHTDFIAGDGIAYLKNSGQHFNTIYIDPARRNSGGKVFMLKDCTPDVVENLDLLLDHTDRLLIKTAPLLDISAGLKELRHVAAIHIVSVKNECRELIWVMEKDFSGAAKIVCTTLNAAQKQFSFLLGEDLPVQISGTPQAGHFLYEPDVALLKSGAFNLIAERYQLRKFHQQTQLYFSAEMIETFPGRIFKIDEVVSAAAVKKEKNLLGSVIVRNYPEKAAALVEKYHIKPDDTQFMVFTQSEQQGRIILKCTILQHY